MNVDVQIVPRERRWISVPYPGRGYWSMSAVEYDRLPRMYVWIDGESVLSNLENRMRRPSRLYRKFLPQILDGLNVPDAKRADIKFAWKQYAGCSCPCSPGFVVSGLPSDGLPFDIYVNISGEADEALIADLSKPKREVIGP